MNADVLLSRLDNPRRTSRGWVSMCPAHDDHAPSLSVGHGRDDRVLVHCFAGCDVADVLAAVGLDVADLFPERVRDLSPLERAERRRAMREIGLVAAICVIDSEASIIAAAVTMVDDGQQLSEADRERLALAVQRIADAREVFA